MQAKLFTTLQPWIEGGSFTPSLKKGLTPTKGEAGSRLLRPLCLCFASNNAGHLQATPLTANDAGTALAALFQVPVKPTPV